MASAASADELVSRRPSPNWIAPALALALVGLTLRGPLVSLGIVSSEVETSLDLDAGRLGLLTTIPVLLFAVAAPSAAAIVSRAGARVCLFIGMLLIAVGSIVRVADGVVPALAGTTLLGLGMTMGNVAVPVLVKEWVSPRRASITTGIYTAALNLGSVLAALATPPLAAAIGWRGALGAWALLALVATVPWVRSRGPRTTLDPGAEVELSRSRGSSFLMIAFAGQGLAYFALIAWLPTILATTLGISADAAGNASALFQVTAIIGAISTAPLLQLLGTARLFVVIAVGWATLPLSLLLAPATWWAGAALSGWAQGATVTLVFALIAERTTSLKQSARVSGLVQFVGYGAGAVGPILFQMLKSLTGSWAASLLVVLLAAAMIAVGGVCAARRFGRPA